MKSPFCFLVNPLDNKRYDNTKEVGDKKLIISSTKEDHNISNRFAKIISTPINYKGPLRSGDIVVVHHNVFKLYYDMKGREKSSRSFLKDNDFLLDDTQLYAYKRKKQWHSLGEYCFIKPAERENSIIFNKETYQPLTGYVAINNSILKKLGVNKGDKVCFKPNSEYEFNIDGEKMYRTKSKNITIKL